MRRAKLYAGLLSLVDNFLYKVETPIHLLPASLSVQKVLAKHASLHDFRLLQAIWLILLKE